MSETSPAEPAGLIQEASGQRPRRGGGLGNHAEMARTRQYRLQQSAYAT